MANEGHTNVKQKFRVTKANHRNLTKVVSSLNAYSLHVIIDFVEFYLFFSVKRVANFCRKSQIPVFVFSSKVSSYNS